MRFSFSFKLAYNTKKRAHFARFMFGTIKKTIKLVKEYIPFLRMAFSYKSWLEKFRLFPDESRIQDQERLEAFLNGFPGEYCGWGNDETLAYSPGFCRLFGIETLNCISDIQDCLTPGDAAALEGVFERLRNYGTSFSISVGNQGHTKIYKIKGFRGQSVSGNTVTDILWVEDISSEVIAKERFSKEKESLKLDKERMEILLDQIPMPIWLRDENQKIIWVNASYSKKTDLKKQEIIAGQRELLTKIRSKKEDKLKNSNIGKELALKAKKTKKAAGAKAHSILDGKRVLLSITEMPLIKKGGTLGFAIDATQEENLQKELQRHHTSNKELFEQLRSAVSIFNAAEKLEFFNSAFSQLWDIEEQWLNTGPKLGEIMEKLRETRRLPEQVDFKRFKQSWLDMFTSLIEAHEEMLHLPDGSTIRMLVVPHSMGGLMMTFEDVTSRLELESSYNTLIAVQKETLDNLEEGVAVYGGDGRLKLFNPSFAQQWQISPEALEGQPHVAKLVDNKKRFFAAKDWEKTKEKLIGLGLDRSAQKGRLKLKDKRLLEFASVPLPDGGVMITFSDITDSARVEQALRDKNEALETAERLKMDFLANVSYQLRTPLNAIMGFNEILEKEYFGPLNDKQHEYTHDINNASERLLSHINDILDLSSLEAGTLELDKKDVKISTMLQSVYDLVQDWARKDNIEVGLKCAKTIGSIDADERRLQQALINLVRNAITFTPAGGKITIGGKRTKEGIWLYVEDTGVGIEKEDKHRIFEPFERANQQDQTSRVSTSGPGLGLSLVRKIAELHGGKIDLDSTPGKGTKASILIPFKE